MDALRVNTYNARAQIEQMIGGAWRTQTLCAAVRLGIIDAITHEPRDAAAIAAACSTNTAATARLLAALTALGVCEAVDAHYRLTSVGQHLRSDAPQSLAAWLQWVAHCSWDAWGDLAECVRSGNAHFVEQAQASNFERFATDKPRSDIYNHAMRERTARIEPQLAQHVLQQHAHVRTIADIGGGFGHLLAAVLDALPEAHGMVVELEHARVGAEALFAQRGLSARARMCVQNFFDSVPPAQLYLLKSVLHNWPDDLVVKLLSRIRAAMDHGAQLLVLETPLPEPGVNSQLSAGVFMSDLNMLVNRGGRERSIAELQALLVAADLRHIHSTSIQGSQFVILTVAAQ
jgi:hypothetical protein